ncbi:MAG: hypothetical protein BAJALOKI1v1_2740002 [Promethearchaeota archaeon]|nr:MAG: hypothetical protein BAJALOKI1v1_2740002 [Candidatus Lokiarchaeota archaeon]
MDIYHRSMSLDVLRQLPPFTTKLYASKDYFKVLEYASVSHISITHTCDVKRRLGERAPSAEQVLKCCRSTPSARTSNFVNDALQWQFHALPKRLQQQLRKSGIIFIDFHQDPYYGERNNPHMKVSKVKASTNRF